MYSEEELTAKLNVRNGVLVPRLDGGTGSFVPATLRELDEATGLLEYPRGEHRRLARERIIIPMSPDDELVALLDLPSGVKAPRVDFGESRLESATLRRMFDDDCLVEFIGDGVHVYLSRNQLVVSRD